MPSSKIRSVASIALLLGFAAVACGPNAERSPPPDSPTVASSTDRPMIKPVTGASSPLIVDWKPEERADLEEAIHDGVAIVRWSDDGLRLLRGCRLDGEYGYLPVQMKKDLVRLESADEVAANLPFGGVGILGKVGAELKRGGTVDIAMAMVGKRRTTWRDVTDQDIKGKCGEATHFVRALLVGAFAMTTGNKSRAAAAAEIFGAGASGSMTSSKDINRADGKLEACERATGDEQKPPPQCAALLRLELEPIAKGATASAKPSAPSAPEAVRAPNAAEIVTCASGFAFRDGKCAPIVADLPHACERTNLPDCQAQCVRGNAQSCNTLGVAIVGTPNDASANGAFERACQLGSASGCANLATRYLSSGNATNANAGLALAEKACALGEPRACETLGEAYWLGTIVPTDSLRAMKYYAKGCDGGDENACTNLGVIYMGGSKGIPVDYAKGVALARRACYGGVSVACGNAGAFNEIGLGIPKNLPLAISLYERACRMSSAECYRLAILEQAGIGMPADEAAAKQMYSASCKAVQHGLATLSCFMERRLYGGTRTLAPEEYELVIKMQAPQCENGTIRSCAFQGVAEMALGRHDAGQARLRSACDKRDPWACWLVKRGF